MYFCLFKSSRDILLSQVLWTTTSTSTHKTHIHTHTQQSWRAFRVWYPMWVRNTISVFPQGLSEDKAPCTFHHANVTYEHLVEVMSGWATHKNSFRSRNTITSSCFVPWKWTVLIMWQYESRLIAWRRSVLEMCWRNIITKMQKPILLYILFVCCLFKPTLWLRGLTCGSAAFLLLELRVRMPPRAWKSLATVVFLGRGLCAGLITHVWWAWRNVPSGLFWMEKACSGKWSPNMLASFCWSPIRLVNIRGKGR